MTVDIFSLHYMENGEEWSFNFKLAHILTKRIVIIHPDHSMLLRADSLYRVS